MCQHHYECVVCAGPCSLALDDYCPTCGTELPTFGRFRPDGWPCCPQCDEDELWSPFLPKPPDYRPGTLEEYVAAGLRCYLCGWELPAGSEVKP